MWTVWIRDHTARSAQSDFDLHCPQKLLGSSSVRKELTHLGNPLYRANHCIIMDHIKKKIHFIQQSTKSERRAFLEMQKIYTYKISTNLSLRGPTRIDIFMQIRCVPFSQITAPYLIEHVSNRPLFDRRSTYRPQFNSFNWRGQNLPGSSTSSAATNRTA